LFLRLNKRHKVAHIYQKADVIRNFNFPCNYIQLNNNAIPLYYGCPCRLLLVPCTVCQTVLTHTVAYLGIFGRGWLGVVQQISLRIQGRENGELGAVAPQSGVPLNLQINETHILIRLLRMCIPRNWEFGSALAKLRNFELGLNPQTPSPLRYTTALAVWTDRIYNIFVYLSVTQTQHNARRFLPPTFPILGPLTVSKAPSPPHNVSITPHYQPSSNTVCPSPYPHNTGKDVLHDLHKLHKQILKFSTINFQNVSTICQHIATDSSDKPETAQCCLGTVTWLVTDRSGIYRVCSEYSWSERCQFSRW
jgi:hypothetical protein